MILFLLLIALFLPSNLWAACGGSSPTLTAASASYADVNDCVTAATYGDTIIVPAGTQTWASTLTITKNITLQGNGVGSTVITRKGQIISWEPDATTKAAHGTLAVSGFTFDGNEAISSELGYQGLITATSDTSIVYLNITANRFKDTSGTAVYMRGTFYGVTGNNDFDRVGIVIRLMGSTSGAPYYVDGLPAWQTFTQSYGTANNYYFENNTIGFSSPCCSDNSGLFGWVETGQGGMIVVRYNTWDLTNGDPNNFFDVHGLQNPAGGPPYDGQCTAYSSLMVEYYGNKFINVNPPTWESTLWQCQRGGWMLMFNNSLTETKGTTWAIDMREYYCDSCQMSGSYVQEISNSYIWNNRQNGTDILPSYTQASPGCLTDLVVENTDYWKSNFASCTDSACASGIGCGSATPTGTCTTGVAYWKTSQSCTDMANMVGASPSTPISGTLYKCTSTNTWEVYYTPYTYPHPLRDDATAPILSSPSPSGQLNCSSNPRNVTRSVVTNENANCRIHASSSTWAEMTPMGTTGTTVHSDTVSLACPTAAQTPYIVCQDLFGNESTATQLSYSVASEEASEKTITISLGVGSQTITLGGGSQTISW